MVTLRSARYPGLIIADLGVRFADGLLETDDPRVIARGRLLGGLGVTVEGGDPEPVRVERREPPRGNASREVWVDYAESVGVEVDESWTRNEIRDAVREAVDL